MIAWLATAALGAPVCDLLPTAGLSTGPVTATLADGGLGRARRVCARSEVGGAAKGLLLVDTENFYGHVVAGAVFDGSWALDEKTELFGQLELVRYDSVISAATASYLGPGHTTLGATRRLDDDGPFAWGVTGKLVLPTAFGLYRNAFPLALDVGPVAQVGSGMFRAHGGLLLKGSVQASRGPAFPRAGLSPTLGGAFVPGKAFAAVLDVQSSFLYDAPVDHLSLAPGLRFAAKRVGIDVAATLPLAGRERALTGIELRTVGRLGAAPAYKGKAPERPKSER